MEFKESIRQLSERINEYKNILHSEEETKRSLILPFFIVLGYDVFKGCTNLKEISLPKRFNKFTDHYIGDCSPKIHFK